MASCMRTCVQPHHSALTANVLIGGSEAGVNAADMLALEVATSMGLMAVDDMGGAADGPAIPDGVYRRARPDGRSTLPHVLRGSGRAGYASVEEATRSAVDQMLSAYRSDA